MKIKSQKVILATLIALVFLLATFSVLWPLGENAQQQAKAPRAPTPSASRPQFTQTSQAITPFRNYHLIATNAVAANLPARTNTATSPVPRADGQISAGALKQIAALEAEKAKRTPVQQKIDSQLLYAEKMRRGIPIADGVPTQRVDLDKDEQGRILLDIKAEVTATLLEQIESLGGRVINNFPQYKAIRAGIPLARIEDLAARTEVKFVQPAVRVVHNNVDSEGDSTHQAIGARATFGVNGSGVKVGVISDSVDYLASSQIAGLVTVLSGQSGTPATGEGTAMLEIVNDLAPGAQLYFATGNGSAANFANNIQQLSAAGCKIIVDDLLFADESPFQDAIVAQAVNAVTANGVLYFSSANNAGNKDAGTSGTWEGDFSDGGQTPSPLEAGSIHNFSSGVNANTVLPGGTLLRADLFWADPLGASTNDYDLYVLDSSGSTVIASSLNTQSGIQDPYESVGTITNGELIVIVKFSGAGRFLHLSTGRGRLSISTQGSTRGHDCATNAFGVAATPANNSYPLAFTGGVANPVETFSSDGPRRVFFQANGTPITPGNFSSSGGAVRQKPDITAADGVTTDLPPGGLNPFYGTSAAAPHAAAIAALLKSYNPNLTQSQIRTILTGTALDIMSPGVDRNSGAGIVMASAALQASPGPDLTRTTDSLNNLSPHTGDVVTVSLTLTNQSCSGGSANAGAFHVGFYFSSAPSFAGITPFYEAPISGCVANGTTLLNQNITMSATPGNYYLGYKINDESEVAECNGNNNGIFYWAVTVLPPPQPDLTKSSDNLSNPNPLPGDTITASLTITNSSCVGGSATAGAFHVGYYWSTSSSFTGVSPFYELSVSGCAANGTVSTNLSILISAGTSPGTYYLGYKIDDLTEVGECNRNNNGIFYWAVTVGQDGTPPTVAISNPINGQVLTTTPFTVTGTAADPGSPTSGLSLVQVRVNGGSWSNATGTTSWTRSVALSPCPNTIEARSLDNAGNYSSIASNFVTYVPPNTPPNTPSNISPPNGTANVSVMPTLQGSAFSDADCVGDTHAASQWQVLNSPGAVIVADSGTDTVNKLSWLVPTNKLYYGSNYQWHVRHQDSRSGWSSYSTQTFFTNGGPFLTASKLGTNMVFKWPTNTLGFALQWSTNLGTAFWSNATPAPVVVGGQNTVTNNMTNNARFYRLKK